MEVSTCSKLGISLAKFILSNPDKREISPKRISFNQNLTPFVNFPPFLVLWVLESLRLPESGSMGFFPLECLKDMLVGSGSLGVRERQWLEGRE